jgi:DNA-binding winged helix-turn-helix (wHTH) protein/uncharacterized membrane protein HdeD (DUF308 family)
MLLTQRISQCVVFGDFRFNMPTRELLRMGEHGSATPVALGSRAADLLHLFLDRPGELITKSEIMDAVWPNMAVEESNLTVQISALRRALGGSRHGARYIHTVPGRGYRFTPWVDEFASRMEAANTGAFEAADESGPALFTHGADALEAVGAPGDRGNGLPDIPLLMSRPLPAVLRESARGGAAVTGAGQPNIWWLSWLNGIAGIVLGLMLITAGGITTTSLVSFLGFYGFTMGMLALVRVFVDPSAPWKWSLTIGVVGILAGIFVVRHLLSATPEAPVSAVAVVGAQGLIMGALEIAAGIAGAGTAPFLLGGFYLMLGVLLLGSLYAAMLAAPLAFGALLLLQGAALSLFALRARRTGRALQEFGTSAAR